VIGVKRGFTLLETVIAIALLSMCVIGFLQALNVAMLGSDQVRQSNAAAELVRSQMEYIQQQDYDCNASSVPGLYGNVSENPLSLPINTTVSDVSGMDYRAIQQITVNVSYSGDKHYMELTDYKTPRLSGFIGGTHAGWLVTKMKDLPTIPCGGFLGDHNGYYYTFTTTANGPVSVMWQFETFAIKGVKMYLYNESGRSQFPSPREGLLKMEPPTTGCIAVESSWFGANREICAIEMTDLPAGEYTIYYYNSGILTFCLIPVPPSKSTITYYK
jgi:prepilin-type N-terminal cleavage/methylation domain-containing protein